MSIDLSISMSKIQTQQIEHSIYASAELSGEFHEIIQKSVWAKYLENVLISLGEECLLVFSLKISSAGSSLQELQVHAAAARWDFSVWKM